ncbi:hypothetical protein [Mycolicibacterium sp.]|uniref:hypothetical protein n=1 Tax=Mycolicibacterium sp. TaxID=2320850 RepID=UPI001A233338|nr:hypothetical protein [Mycolicibacterium sp.]MBJ7338598.1 hypothetical protein [Mycolicibacterium sp.]
MARPNPRGRQVIEATLTRWTIGALGVLAIAVATLFPWYSAQAVGGSADMAGWGAWTMTGDVDAGLRPLPLAVLVYAAAALTVYGAARSAFGIAVVGAMATFAAAILPFLVMRAVDRHVPGSGSVAVAVTTAPLVLLGIGFVATIVCWIGYARCVLRPSPRQEP